MLIEISVILSMELFVIMLAMLFDMLPGNRYKMHKPQIQILMAIAMFVLGVINLFVVTVQPDIIIAENTDVSAELLRLYLGFYGIVLACSIFKYVDYKKMVKNYILFL
ncbi:hypothetical protein SAMN02910298_01948 [Pseudobutyrivibrio sp. YE44]|uniref:hypothetical protein n=1 Tax=Pseudobutyrivibrio sp. YE44 TaxID=1520802 RepID=UPI0008806DC2|nr:hypothetical protein [Pseudobutyrivibrio sp. YE44]SDB39971.1 hypothetical protein SAMN02910298_01948 [Pseudobutyrivibrio sp. YE44]